MIYVFVGLIIAVIAAGMYFNSVRNKAIKRGGIETDATVTRVKETAQTDEDGSVTYDTTYYVTFTTADGKQVEAKLGSGKSIDVHIGGKSWDKDLREGSSVRIKYLPDKPTYVIRA